MQAHCQEMVNIVDDRRKCLSALLDTDSTGNALKIYIESFTSIMGADPQTDLSPPIRSYASLKSLPQLRALFDDFSKAQERDELEEKAKNFVTSKKIVQSCITASKNVASELAKAMKAFSEVGKKRVGEASNVPNMKRPRKAEAAALDPILEYGASGGSQVRRLGAPWDALKGTDIEDSLDVNVPFLIEQIAIRQAPEYKALTESASAAEAEGPVARQAWTELLGKLEKQFKEHLEKDGSARAACGLEACCELGVGGFASGVFLCRLVSAREVC